VFSFWEMRKYIWALNVIENWDMTFMISWSVWSGIEVAILLVRKYPWKLYLAAQLAVTGSWFTMLCSVKRTFSYPAAYLQTHHQLRIGVVFLMEEPIVAFCSPSYTLRVSVRRFSYSTGSVSSSEIPFGALRVFRWTNLTCRITESRPPTF